MAITAFGTNDSQTVKIWSSLTMRDMLKSTLFNKFVGTGKSAIIQRLSELEKTAGDTIKYDLLMQMAGAGVTGDNRMRDNDLFDWQATLSAIAAVRKNLDLMELEVKRIVARKLPS